MGLFAIFFNRRTGSRLSNLVYWPEYPVLLYSEHPCVYRVFTHPRQWVGSKEVSKFDSDALAEYLVRCIARPKGASFEMKTMGWIRGIYHEHAKAVKVAFALLLSKPRAV